MPEPPKRERVRLPPEALHRRSAGRVVGEFTPACRRTRGTRPSAGVEAGITLVNVVVQFDDLWGDVRDVQTRRDKTASLSVAASSDEYVTSSVPGVEQRGRDRDAGLPQAPTAHSVRPRSTRRPLPSPTAPGTRSRASFQKRRGRSVGDAQPQVKAACPAARRRSSWSAKSVTSVGMPVDAVKSSAASLVGRRPRNERCCNRPINPCTIRSGAATTKRLAGRAQC